MSLSTMTGSRDALRAWSGWASSVIHGPRLEPDHGQHYYKPDHWQHYELDRLDLLGPARDLAGAGSVTRTYLGWSGSRLKVVATASRTGTSQDQPRCAVMGK
jgi:hypothetical protein